MTPGDRAGARTWLDPTWRAAALHWAGEQAARAGIEIVGEPEQPHVRAWSTAFRLPSADGGSLWLKSVGPGSAHEPALTGALGRWVPGAVLAPLAVDPGRRLLLLPDGGRTLRDAGSPSLPAWEAMLREHARLQVTLAPHAAELLELGVPDHRPDRLPGLVADLVADDDAQLLGRPDGLPREDRDRIRSELRNYGAACRRLAEGGIPATLQHDDLHDANVVVSGGRYRFFDWGDSSVAHPFLTLVVSLRMAARALGLPSGHAGLFRLRDAYLEQWWEFGTAGELRAQCDLALRIGPLQRALTWRRILAGVHADERAEWAGSVPGWTAEHLAPGTLATG